MNKIQVKYESLKSSDIFGPNINLNKNTKTKNLNYISEKNNDYLESMLNPVYETFNSITSFSKNSVSTLLGGDIKSVDIISIILMIIVIGLVVVLLCQYMFSETEHMSGGTLTQLFAQDSQNTYLNGAGPGVQSGNFMLGWNQPTRVASGTNRGVPLAKIDLPKTSMNPKNKPKNLSKLAKKAGLVVPCENNCSTKNPSQCGNDAGNICRIESGWNEPASDDDARPYVGLNGNLVYPTGYLGSLYVSPEPDVMKPLPYIKPMNNI